MEGTPAPRSFDVDAFLALPRLAGLAVAPDSRRLVVGAALLDADGLRYRPALFALDGAGDEQPRRLTWSQAGGSAPRFAPDGSLVYTAARAHEPAGEGPPPAPGVWRLPAGGGEPAPVATPPAGVAAFAIAARHGRVAVATGVHPDSDDWEADGRRQQERRRAGVSAVLFDTYPVTDWDRWVGPRRRRLFAQRDGGAFVALTPDAGTAFEHTAFDVAPDGRAVVTGWHSDAADPRERVSDLVLVPLAADGTPGRPRPLLAEPRVHHAAPRFSPDGRQVACMRLPLGTPERCPDFTLVVVDVASGACRDVLPGFDRWPLAPAWAPDGRSLYFTADDGGHAPPFRVDLDSGAVVRLAREGAYTDLAPAPDGRCLYALRSTVVEPPHVVALDPDAADQEPRRVPCPGPAPGTLPPHRLERVATTLADGTRVPGWLLLPVGGGPAPLLVLLHGGPEVSWNAWHWRWNPHLFAAQGWAVLMPDHALSTGYGLDYVQRGWGRWGGEPCSDVLALVDEVSRRADVDGQRLAAAGASYGGYLVNWIAGNTDRFRALIAHGALWDVEAFHGAGDRTLEMDHEFGDRYRQPEAYLRWSPHRLVQRMRTPMLVSHGGRDLRVPPAQPLTQWADLRCHGVEAQLLVFPDENHFVLAPPHTRVAYATMFAFLDHHVRGAPWRRPDLL